MNKTVSPENLLRAALSSGRFFHAYLLVGPKEAGTDALASKMAKELVRGTEETGNHPDIIYIKPDKKTTISAEYVREGIVSAVNIRPYHSNYRVFIIENADWMNAVSQNILLKTLENPPDYAIFILCAENEDLILPTVLSRVSVVRCASGSDFSDDTEASSARGDIFSILENIDSLSSAEILIKVRNLEEYKDNAGLLLDYITEWYRNAAIIDDVVDIEHVIRQIESARRKLRFNAGFLLVMEVLFLNLGKRGVQDDRDNQY